MIRISDSEIHERSVISKQNGNAKKTFVNIANITIFEHTEFLRGL